MTYATFFDDYARAPAPERIVDALGWLVDERILRGIPPQGSLDALVDGDAKLLPALGLLFARHPYVARDAVAAFARRDEALQRTIAMAAWMGGVARGTLPSSSFVDDLYALAPVPVEQLPLAGPVVLDMLWGAFFVTGDARYVWRIAEALPLIDDDAPVLRATAQAAIWSLQANATRHPVVDSILTSLLGDVPRGDGYGLAERRGEHLDGSVASFARAAWLIAVLCIALLAPTFVVFGALALLPEEAVWSGPGVPAVASTIAIVGGFALCTYLFRRQDLALRPLRVLTRRLRTRTSP